MKRFPIGLCVFVMVGMSWEVSAFDKEHIKKLKALGSCPSCDLSESDLAGARYRTGLDKDGQVVL